MYGEPFADSSALPTYLVSRTARRHVTVSLSGDGGDEAFGGYPRYDYLELGAHLTRLLGPAGKLLVPVLSKFPGKLRRGAPLLELPLPEIYRRLLTIFGPDEVRALTGRLPNLDTFDSAWQVASRQAVRRRAMLIDLLTYLPDAILTKVDRAAMAVSLETRAPLLDHRILEFALQLPTALVHRKRLLRHWVYRRVPRAARGSAEAGIRRAARPVVSRRAAACPVGRAHAGPTADRRRDGVLAGEASHRRPPLRGSRSFLAAVGAARAWTLVRHTGRAASTACST